MAVGFSHKKIQITPLLVLIVIVVVLLIGGVVAALLARPDGEATVSIVNEQTQLELQQESNDSRNALITGIEQTALTEEERDAATLVLLQDELALGNIERALEQVGELEVRVDSLSEENRVLFYNLATAEYATDGQYEAALKSVNQFLELSNDIDENSLTYWQEVKSSLENSQNPFEASTGIQDDQER